MFAGHKAVMKPLTLTDASSWPVARRCLFSIAAGTALLAPLEADAYTITITSGARAIYLQVGAGGYTGTYSSGGTPGNNTSVTVVSVTVPAAAIGSGTAQAMTSNSTTSVSPIDGFVFCDPPSEVYIGAWSRPGSGNGPNGTQRGQFCRRRIIGRLRAIVPATSAPLVCHLGALRCEDM